MKKKILMTGVSGFLGSALAARFIEQGHNILYFAAHKEDLIRAQESIKQIYDTKNLQINVEDNLQLIQCENLYSVSEVESALKEIKVDEVWHVAAHMSYDFLELPQSIKFNAVISTNIMSALKECDRYYFISTTGIAGLGEGLAEEKVVPEALLTDFDSLNPYTTSKVLAEYMLWHHSEALKIPLTIIRPGSIIGDSETGWSNGTKFGYYSYLYPLKKFRKKDITFFLNIDPNKKFPVIHSNHLVDLCCNLQARSAEQCEAQEIFHGCNTNLLTAAEHFKIYEEVSQGKLKVDYGEGTLGFNKVFNEMNAHNNKFLGVNCRYENKKLIKTLGKELVPPDLSKEGIARVIKAYLEK